MYCVYILVCVCMYKYKYIYIYIYIYVYILSYIYITWFCSRGCFFSYLILVFTRIVSIPFYSEVRARRFLRWLHLWQPSGFPVTCCLKKNVLCHCLDLIWRLLTKAFLWFSYICVFSNLHICVNMYMHATPKISCSLKQCKNDNLFNICQEIQQVRYFLFLVG